MQKRNAKNKLKEDKKKQVSKVKILDGANISVFLVHFFTNFNTSRIRVAKLLCSATSQSNTYSASFEKNFYNTVDGLLFAFNEESLSKIEFEDFIVLDRYLAKFLTSLPETNQLAEKWLQRSSRYYIRHSLNYFLATLKEVSCQNLASCHLENKLTDPADSRSQELPDFLMEKYKTLSKELNQMLLERTMSETFHKFIERLHKVVCFLIQLQTLESEVTSPDHHVKDKHQESTTKVCRTIEVILASMLFVYLRFTFALNNPHHLISVIVEDQVEAEKKNIWDRSGLFNFNRLRIKYKCILDLEQWLTKAANNPDFDHETLSYLKQLKNTKVDFESQKTDNKFGHFENTIKTFLDTQRFKELIELLKKMNMIEDAVGVYCFEAIRSIQSCLSRTLIAEKLPIESLVMCLVSRKFEPSKPKDYIVAMGQYLKSLEDRLHYAAKGGVAEEDRKFFVYLSKQGLLNFSLEVFQDMLTKTSFSSDQFDKIAEDYNLIKQAIGCAPDDTHLSDLTSMKLLEVRDSLGDKTRTLQNLAKYGYLFSTLFSRKLFDKFMTPADTEQLKASLIEELKA